MIRRQQRTVAGYTVPRWILFTGLFVVFFGAIYVYELRNSPVPGLLVESPREQSDQPKPGSLQLDASSVSPSPPSTAINDQAPKPAYNLPQLRIPVWWFAPFLDASSFGSEASTLVLSLLDSELIAPHDIWISLLQMECKDYAANTMEPWAHATLTGLLRHVNKSRPATVVCHNMPKFFGRPSAPWRSCAPCPPAGYKAAYAIGRAMAETDRFDGEFVRTCNTMDEIWVPSEFSRSVLQASGVDPNKLHIVPLATNTTFFNPAVHVALKLPHGIQVTGVPANATAHASAPYVFASIFKWEQRKGWDVLLKAYLTEFSAQDAVQLYILTVPFIDEKDVKAAMDRWINRNLNISQASLPQLFVIPDRLTAKQYVQLLAAANAFVLPTRGEGWGLPITEAMSMGLPVIVTNCTGVSAYLDESVGYPIKHTWARVPEDAFSWYKGSRWVEPDVEHLRSLMRQVVQHPQHAKAKGEAARARMLEQYSPHAVALKLYKEFKRIEDKLQA